MNPQEPKNEGSGAGTGAEGGFSLAPWAPAAPLGSSKAAAAEFFGISENSIYRWRKKGWLVEHSDGTVDLDATAARVNAARDVRGGKPDRGLGLPLRYERPGGAGDADTDDSDDTGDGRVTFEEARRRKELALAEKAELEVARLRGDLIPVNDARKVYVSVVTSARVALEAVAPRVAPALLGLTSQVEIQRLVQNEIATALRSLPDVAPDVD